MPRALRATHEHIARHRSIASQRCCSWRFARTPAETIPYAVGVGELMSDEASQAGHNLKVAIQDPQLFGSPKQAILDAGRQWPADLIVVGAHGHSGVGRFLFGGVSEAVAMHAGCSVEVIRDKAKR